MKKKQIIYSFPDLVIKLNSTNILSGQASNFINKLPGWEVYEPYPNGGKAPTGTYTQVWSPIFDRDTNDLELEVQKIYDSLKSFITDLNSQGKTISRVDCWIDQSDDISSVPHPSNELIDHSGMTKEYRKTGDYKLHNWIFCDFVKINSFGECYGNIFFRETNNVKLIKKYYTIHIDSSWGSI
jgi:hypothetical protein